VLLSAVQADSEATVFAEAEALWKQGSRDQAVALLRQHCETQPEAGPAYLRAADFWVERGRFQVGVPFAQRACDLIQGDPRPLAVLGLCYSRTQRRPEAEATFRKGVERFPRDPGLLFNLGLSCRINGKVLEAQQHLDVAVKLQPKNRLFCFTAGENLVLRNRYEEAEQRFRVAASDPGHHPDAYWRLGQMLGFLHRPVEADEWFQRALDDVTSPRPAYQRARYRYAVFLYEQRRFQDAVPHLSGLLADQPKHRMGWMYLARCQRGLGQTEEARESMKRYQSIQAQEDAADTEERLRALAEAAKKKRDQ
jgi:tetratricopeptide (TPR) repeat protein